MAKTCEAMFYDERKHGRKIWGKGEQKSEIIGTDDGWRRCTAKTDGEVRVLGRLHLVCDEHKRQIELLQRDHSPLLTKVRWAA